MPEDSIPAALYTQKVVLLFNGAKTICISFGYICENEQKIFLFNAKNVT
jgi:hypothetical protein